MLNRVEALAQICLLGLAERATYLFVSAKRYAKNRHAAEATRMLKALSGRAAASPLQGGFG
ncbi:hypothetical protein KA047_01235 [Candidatus Saccharibacteria bacterium]|nr:hypothetical protein [Candidatus Saccharibacteria bacterium]